MRSRANSNIRKEPMTSRITKTAAGLLAAATIAASSVAFTSPAQAHWHGGWGWGGAGFAAGLMLGAAAADNAYNCGPVNIYDRYGNYIRTVRRCW
jgi:hypothetical protein